MPWPIPRKKLNETKNERLIRLHKFQKLIFDNARQLFHALQICIDNMDQKEAKTLIENCIPGIHKWNESTSSEATVPQLENIQVKALCRLWGGMGYVYSVSLSDSSIISGNFNEVIIKRVSSQSRQRQSFGDKRKADSYLCEANFYETLAPYLIKSKGLHIPRPFLIEREYKATGSTKITICMEKIYGSVRSVDRNETRAVLRWLATLHAATWGAKADEAVAKHGLQPTGTYWYLDTRPDEHASMRNSGWQGRLKLAAKAIDERLKRDKMQCCVHGDAKDANMLFSCDEDKNLSVSMYDFQYCGKSPPTKDLAYFLCVAAYDNDQEHVKYYHQELIARLDSDCDYQPTLDELNQSLLLAYCDWCRFMCGWGFWGISIEDHVISVLDRLDGGQSLGSADAYHVAVQREFG